MTLSGVPRSSSPATCLIVEEIRERVLALGARAPALAKQTPLLQIAQMVLGDGGIEAADLPETIRPAGPAEG